MWGCGEGVCGLADGLGQGLGCIQSRTIELRLGQSSLWVQSFRLQRGSQGFVLGCCAMSTKGCSAGTK